MAYYVKPGRAVTTKRGVVTAESANPELKPSDLCGDPADAKARLEVLLKRGHLTKTKPAGAPPLAPVSPSAPANPGGGAARKSAAQRKLEATAVQAREDATKAAEVAAAASEDQALADEAAASEALAVEAEAAATGD